jgi:hypothetical protein
LPPPRGPRGTELLERDRVDRVSEELGQDLADQEPGAREALDRAAGRAAPEPVVEDQGRVGRVAADPAGVERELAGRVVANRVVEARGLVDPVAVERGVDLAVEALGLADPAGVERELAGRVAADLVAQAARRGRARGPELAVTAARPLFPVSLLVSLVEDLPGAVNQRKKSCLEFSVH